jgi:transcription elongation factor GreA-like protein
MHCYFVVELWTVRLHTPKKEHAFQHADTTFKAAILSVLEDSIVDAYVLLQTGKEMGEALEAKYGVSDASSELYVMEQFHDYRMIDDHSAVEQAYEIQTLVKELKIFGYVLPDKSVADYIIANLPQAWTDFATSLKHKK